MYICTATVGALLRKIVTHIVVNLSCIAGFFTRPKRTDPNQNSAFFWLNFFMYYASTPLIIQSDYNHYLGYHFNRESVRLRNIGLTDLGM